MRSLGIAAQFTAMKGPGLGAQAMEIASAHLLASAGVAGQQDRGA